MTDKEIKELEKKAAKFEPDAKSIKFLLKEKDTLYFIPYYKHNIEGGTGLPYLLAYVNGAFYRTSSDTYFRLT